MCVFFFTAKEKILQENENVIGKKSLSDNLSLFRIFLRDGEKQQDENQNGTKQVTNINSKETQVKIVLSGIKTHLDRVKNFATETRKVKNYCQWFHFTVMFSFYYKVLLKALCKIFS